MTKRPADSWPMWCAKGRLSYLGHIDKRWAAQMMGSDQASTSEADDDKSDWMKASGFMMKVLSKAEDTFVQRADDAASTSDILKAYSIIESSAAEGDTTKESCGRECAILRARVSHTCKAQACAQAAARAASDALKVFVAASEAAHVRQSRFGKALEFAQMIAACHLDSEVLYKDAVRIELPGGMCAVDDPHAVWGRISGGARFFVRIISADAAFASWSGGFVVSLDVNQRDTIEEVKAKLQDKCGIMPAQLRLMHKGQKLRNQETLQSYGIVDDDRSDWMVLGIYCASMVADQPAVTNQVGIYATSMVSVQPAVTNQAEQPADTNQLGACDTAFSRVWLLKM